MKIWKNRKTKKRSQDLQKRIKEYNRRTAEITDEMAMDMLDTDKRNDYLELLNIADHAHMGKSRAILTAFKLGYLQGRAVHEPDMCILEIQDTVSEVSIKIRKASTALRTTVEANLLDRTDLGHAEITAIGANASNICDMIYIANDYLYHAQKELEGILE